MKSTSVSDEDVSVIGKMIKKQKTGLLLFPLVILFYLFKVWADYHYQGKVIPNIMKWFLPLLFIHIVYFFIILPIRSGLLLGKVFYSVDVIDDSNIKFTSYATLWRKAKVVKTSIKNIEVKKTALPKLLYDKYSLNKIIIGGKRYYILNKVFQESGMLDCIGSA